MTRELPDFLRDLLNSPPHAGAGVHRWLFKVSRQLHSHFPAIEIVAMLESRLQNCGRCVPRSEILDAVKNSLPAAWAPNKKATAFNPSSRWPEVNKPLRDEILAEELGLADLWEASPIRLEDNASHAEEIIDRLFPGNPLICCGKSNSIFETKPREDWRGQLAELSLIVPSPMSALMGRKKNPRPGESELSAHSLDNTGPRRFLVVEFDTGSTEEQAGLLLHLAGFAPMVCAVHSGGKSVHGWFLVAGQPDEKVEKFFKYAVSLGADPALWTRSQFVRLPDGLRDNGKRQTVYFLNCKPLEARA